MLKLQRHWYRPSLNLVTLPLLPLSWGFRSVVALRRFFYRTKVIKSHQFPVPVIIVGNITVGGTGKTPFVIWTVNFLKSKGYKPGIVSRGVGGQQQYSPRWVESHSEPKDVGDEALLLQHRALCPVVIGIDRVAAVRKLLADTDCDIVISDDGLQHYRLGRDVEIAIMDGARGLGNQQFLPAGPLRESGVRLKEVDFVVRQEATSTPSSQHEFSMYLFGEELVLLKDGSQKTTLDMFRGKTVHAVAAIGNPERFFASLRNQGIQIIEHIFPDHYLYQPHDLNFNDDLPIIMTEKDAMKCRSFANERCWFLPVEMKIDESFGEALLRRIKQ